MIKKQYDVRAMVYHTTICVMISTPPIFKVPLGSREMADNEYYIILLYIDAGREHPIIDLLSE